MIKQYLVGIDLGGTQLRITIAYPKTAQIIMKKSYLSPFAVNNDLSQFFHLKPSQKANAYVLAKIQECIREANINPKQILGIGVSVAGKVFPDKTFIGANIPKKFAKKIGNKYAIDLFSELKKTFKVKIEIENDANCAGIAQSIYYAQQGLDPLKTFYITLSTG
ncbi:MAG: ROK family protein, partial [candidate division WOR-3 bacterium]|nr:ROK family protein [candidate division WOR-3 bacterium]